MFDNNDNIILKSVQEQSSKKDYTNVFEIVKQNSLTLENASNELINNYNTVLEFINKL